MLKPTEVRKLLGQVFSVGFSGTELSLEMQKFIRENQIAGVTYFAENYESPGQIAELSNQIQSLRGSAPPLFLAVDHEGGKVWRFKKNFTKFPEARVLGDENSPKIAYEAASVIARELKAVGINTNFAPVADINTNPGNPVIGRRSFGETEEIVSKMVSAQVRGFLTEGIQPVVKHFPGHGDTTKDSHFHLPRVKTDLDMLRKREFEPFAKAFKSKCQLVMTAHIIVEAVDPKLPATLCRQFLETYLRDELRFRGLVISDDMEMKAIADHFGEADAALMALEAGVNLLLYHTEPFETRAFEAILTKLTSPSGKNALIRLQQSAARVTEFRSRNLSFDRPIVIPEIAAQIGTKEHLDLAKRLEKLAIKQQQKA